MFGSKGHRRTADLRVRVGGKLGLALALTISVLAACTNTVDRPPAFTGEQRDSGITYAQAVTYLNEARTNLQQALDNSNSFDAVTKGGTGLGVAGAGVSAIFRSAINPILGFVTLGAVSYSANQLVDPVTLSGIYSAGLSNLDCIDDAGVAARQSAVALRNRYAELQTAIAALRGTVARAQAAKHPALYKVDVERARTMLATADATRRALADYLNSNSVAEAMVSGVNATITAVNQQVRAKSPSIDAIARSGSIFGTFTALNSGVRSEAQTALNTFRKQAAGTVQGATDEITKSLAEDAARLQAVLAQIPAHLDPPNLAGIARCQMQFTADMPIAIQPPGPINLAPGDSASLTATGRPPYRLVWLGAIPSDVDVNINFDQVKLTAHSKAATQIYTFQLIDFAYKASSSTTLVVGPKSGGSTQKPNSTTLDGMSFGDQAKAIGLNPAQVTSKDDPAFITRVKTLQECVKLPQDGKLSQQLLDKLNGSDCVAKAIAAAAAKNQVPPMQQPGQLAAPQAQPTPPQTPATAPAGQPSAPATSTPAPSTPLVPPPPNH